MADAYHHDPYREVEMYLEQAQEEIGRAFAELASYEFSEPSDHPLTSSPDSILASPSLCSTSSKTCSPDPLCDEGIIASMDDIRNTISPITKEHRLQELTRPPSGDMDKLSAWAELFVQEINAHLTFDDLDSAGESQDDLDMKPAIVKDPSLPNSFRSLPLNRNHNHVHQRISHSFRTPGVRRRYHPRRLWSWPPGWDSPPPNTKAVRRKTKDAEVQTNVEQIESVLNGKGKEWDYVRDSSVKKKAESVVKVKVDGPFEWTDNGVVQLDTLMPDEMFLEPPSCLPVIEKDEMSIEVPSNWKFKNFVTNHEQTVLTEEDERSSYTSSDTDRTGSVIGALEEDFEAAMDDIACDGTTIDDDGDSWSSASSSRDGDTFQDCSYGGPSGGPLSFTVSWLTAEDDSDHLECKELPRLDSSVTGNCLLEVNGTFEGRSPQKSPSSTLSSVSRHELDTFLKKVASSVYQPPPPLDGDIRLSPQQDAVTQTTPDLSRSSSFTWVTDCDCSDLSITRPRTAPSQDSLPSFSDCPSSDATRDSSSPSLSEDSPSSSEGSMSASGGKRVERNGSVAASSQGVDEVDFKRTPKLDILGSGMTPGITFEFKSSSAPQVMAEVEASALKDCLEKDYATIKALLAAQRSHSARQLTELEAIEACTWLRAAGFPQYSQMYEDNLFPIDITGVRKDHEFLDPDAIQSLFRRLNTLNKCARLKSDGFPRKSVEESDEEDHCALSENWQFQRSSRRWSRILPLSPNALGGPPSSPKAPASGNRLLSPNIAINLNCNNNQHHNHHHGLLASQQYRAGPDNNSRDSVFLDDPLQSSPESLRKSEFIFTMGLPMEEDFSSCYLGPCGSPAPHTPTGSFLERSHHGSSLRRSGSERVKDGYRAFLRGVESLKGKRKKNRETVIIGGTVGDDIATMATPTNSVLIQSNGQSQSEEGVEGKTNWTAGTDDSGALSDSECLSGQSPTPIGNERIGKRRNGSGSSLEDGRTTNANQSEQIRLRQPIKRAQWLTSEDGEKQSPDRRSLYDNVPASAKVSNGANSSLPSYNRSASTKSNERTSDTDNPGSQEDMDISGVTSERRDSGVGLSLTRPSGSPVIQSRWHCFAPTLMGLQLPAPCRVSSGRPVLVNSMPAPQLMVLRKFSLLKLTALMEKYSPSNRAGWNWGMPKFIRRIRTPDYKDKNVFGVPLVLNVQRSGQPLPPAIQLAMNFLKENGLEATGIFRKPGVRSRIQMLRNLCETNALEGGKPLVFDNQQVYDVADMVKQYFRELPDALLTNKLSETFISIFQHIPEELRLEATQAAVLLMPDENREALQSLLAFLDQVSQHSDENQMTTTNLAVCLAPSLFHLSIPRSASASPRRRKTVGIPDQKDLNENRAAHLCLTTMIDNYHRLFLVPEDTMLHCRLSILEPCEPPTLEDMSTSEESKVGTQEGWKNHMESCIQGLLKEARDKFRGWVPLSPVDGVDIAYKKVGDGHPLKLWKVSVEVEAPPVELLNRILRERHLWDEKLLKWSVVNRLEKHAEIFQYVTGTMEPHPPRDYVTLRYWKIDTLKATCVLVETSVDHPDASSSTSNIRGVVLASRFLIEPCGSGKSKVTHITRIDTRGRSPEWYNKVYGQNSGLLLSKLRDSFKQAAEGPETKV